MINWRKGGMSGSILRLARQEVTEHLNENPTARHLRYSLPHRIARRFFNIGTFGAFVRLYIYIDVVFLAVEAVLVKVAPNSLSTWVVFDPATNNGIDGLILSISGYFLAAQAGALGVITLALALVTLIAQRESSDTDIALYYHESMAFQIVPSSVALLAVLATQLLWPLQFFLHRFQLGSQNLIFEFVLLGIHLAWLLINLAAIAHFIDTTFKFVQQSRRETLRKRYTANIVFPPDLERRLCETLYLHANSEVGEVGRDDRYDLPSAAFGFDPDRTSDLEISSKFSNAVSLQDVRMLWVRWVFQRWSRRCIKKQEQSECPPSGLNEITPKLWFTLHMFYPMNNTIVWCRREGGVPLTVVEKFVLRRSFVFGRVRDEE